MSHCGIPTDIVLLCAGRKKADFRRATLEALRKTLAAFPRQDHFAAAAPPLLAALRAHAEAQAAVLAGASQQARPSFHVCIH